MPFCKHGLEQDQQVQVCPREIYFIQHIDEIISLPSSWGSCILTAAQDGETLAACPAAQSPAARSGSDGSCPNRNRQIAHRAPASRAAFDAKEMNMVLKIG